MFDLRGRIHVEQHIARESMFIQIYKDLFGCFEFGKGASEDGREIEPKIQFTSAILLGMYVPADPHRHRYGMFLVTGYIKTFVQGLQQWWARHCHKLISFVNLFRAMNTTYKK